MEKNSTESYEIQIERFDLTPEITMKFVGEASGEMRWETEDAGIWKCLGW